MTMENNKMRVAVIQMHSGEDKKENLRSAVRLLHKAISRKAQFILLPEIFNFRGRPSSASRNAETIPGETIKVIADIASRKKVYILAGSIYERAGAGNKFYNSSVLIDDRGAIQAIYRKMHLFDVHVQGRTVRESKILLQGRRPVLTSVAGVKIGLSICYDLRFPELCRAYSKAGAQLLCVPSCFTYATGQAHWEILLRARAIENQCFVAAPNQCGAGAGVLPAYGNSMIIDPWGRIMARASSDKPEVIDAELDFRKQAASRKDFPALKHRRL